MDAIVQLTRNALCCMKDLGLFRDTSLWDSAVVYRLYRTPDPMWNTTPLEALISVTQFYVCVSATLAGYSLIKRTGSRKLLRITNLISARSSSDNHHSDKIVNEGLRIEGAASVRSMFVGLCVTCIGVSFFWLSANSWHVTETDLIGGEPALIAALVICELFLIPLLYYMFMDGRAMFAKAKRMKVFAITLKNSKGKLCTVGGEKLLNYETYSWIVSGGWAPFWSDGVADQTILEDIEEKKKFSEEAGKVKITVDRLLATTDSDEKEQKVLKQSLDDTAARLESEAHVVVLEAYREYLYFVINLIAFYGYLMGIICYYFDVEEEQHHHVKKLKFGYSNDHADWHGNFAGDLMWTIEPIIILCSPAVIKWLKPKQKKIKSD